MENQKDTYKNLIENLRSKKPELDQPENFTDQVMQGITNQPSTRKTRSFITDEYATWRLFIGFRNAMAVAAIFLVGFFVYQQWEIMSKVSGLEQQIQNQREAPISLSRLETTPSERIKQLLDQKLSINTSDLKKSVKPQETVILQKSILNYLLESLDQLEKENRQLRNSLSRQNADSVKKIKNENLKTL